MAAARTEINRLEKVNSKSKEDYDKLYREFSMLKLYIHDLESKVSKLENNQQTIPTGHYKEQAAAAMKRFTAKLKEEGERNAKQKQSQR